VQHLPHWFHASTVVATLLMELALVWMLFLPRRWRIVCFFLVTPWQIAVILTANYAFLNYIVLALGFLLLDDRSLVRFVPTRWRGSLPVTKEPHAKRDPANGDSSQASEVLPQMQPARIAQYVRAVRLAVIAVALSWDFYATTLPMLRMFWPEVPLPIRPVALLEPFRIANQYGLFAVMTPHRYEIEFQGSNDGLIWVAYPFRYKPQDVAQPPRIYAPYQPRFDWNLWFASLGSWTQYLIVPRTEELLLINDSDVLQLFAGNPFPDKPPRLVRAVLWQYWFSTMKEKRTQGIWWRRQLLGTYAPTLMVGPNGRIVIVAEPLLSQPQE
jgi:lipase maturation factor 1